MDVFHFAEFGKLKYVHHTIDTYSGFQWATALSSEKADSVIMHLLEVMAIMGIPAQIKTDNAPAYVSGYPKDTFAYKQVLAKFCSPSLGIPMIPNYLAVSSVKQDPEGPSFLAKFSGHCSGWLFQLSLEVPPPLMFPMTVTPLWLDQDCSLKNREPDVLSWFLDPGGWSKTTSVGLYFIFPGICTLSLVPSSCQTYAKANPQGPSRYASPTPAPRTPTIQEWQPLSSWSLHFWRMVRMSVNLGSPHPESLQSPVKTPVLSVACELQTSMAPSCSRGAGRGSKSSVRPNGAECWIVAGNLRINLAKDSLQNTEEGFTGKCCSEWRESNRTNSYRTPSTCRVGLSVFSSGLAQSP
ncbi:hypothetical protein STEG23_002123 [Scotinomys teguina]